MGLVHSKNRCRVLERHPEHLDDDLQRQLGRHLGDEVAAPFCATASTMLRARLRMCSSAALRIFGEKPMLTRRRYFVCRGGSMLSMISRCGITFSSGYGGIIALPRSDENVF